MHLFDFVLTGMHIMVICIQTLIPWLFSHTNLWFYAMMLMGPHIQRYVYIVLMYITLSSFRTQHPFLNTTAHYSTLFVCHIMHCSKNHTWRYVHNMSIYILHFFPADSVDVSIKWRMCDDHTKVCLCQFYVYIKMMYV